MSYPDPFTPYTMGEFWREQLVAALDAQNRDPITTTYTGVGLVAFDDACGQLVVTPLRVYRTTAFPLESTEREHPVADQMIVVELAATLIRCVPTPDSKGNPPSSTDLATAHQNILEDAAILWSIVNGDLEPLGYPYAEWERANIQQTFEGAEGGAVACITQWLIGIEERDWCL